ncbi:unnamed protein product [Kluyveromyces dobzhanskii CBS 2104]|uniref:WGS project CCBQ000000000 data, contig 00266 n=1 Tax=Kluyveromyces dobzhanskii CBS 2104 TaxID=1427455 RepID=A0A0A8L7K0_9SACH|nr:unnamed protein product [Kluyveromyces dobzhanskii CBS 2104]
MTLKGVMRVSPVNYLQLLACASIAFAMDMDDTTEYTRPEITAAGSKTCHWLASISFLLLLPSFSACLTFGGKVYSSLFFQSITFGYCFLEALFLNFADGDGIENRTSKGCSWALLLLSGLTVFVGAIYTGSNFLLRNNSVQKALSHISSTKVEITHRILSMLCVIGGWVKICLAPVALFGFCRGKHTGQCIAHGIMGTAFVLYGFVYATVLVIPWLRNNEGKYSQDFYDCCVMCVWGIVNTFTEHRWGREKWNHGDYQHTAMGIIWWAGGLTGMYLSRNGNRTFVPGLLIIFTGWAMSEHTQKLVISTKVHHLFGLVLMSGGALRIVEVAFLLKDRRTDKNIHSFQYLPAFCLICSGILFMGANEEQLILVLRLGADHGAYSLVLISGAFLVFLWQLVCLNLYLRLVEKKAGSFLDNQHSEESVVEFSLGEINNLSE